MKKQNKISLFKRKGFYTAAVLVITLLLIADIVVGLLPVMPTQSDRGGFRQSADMQMPEMGEMPSDMEMPDGMEMPDMGEMPSGMERPEGMEMPEGMDNFRDMTQDTTQSTNTGILQTIKSIWIPVAIVLALLDAVCIFMLLRLRRQEKARKALEEKQQMEALRADGEVHLVRKKKKTRRHSAWWLVAPVAVMVVLAMVVQLFSGTTGTELPRTEASILSGTAELTDLNITLPGTGTLTEETAESITLVSGVEISNWYVSDGDTVSEGDALAAVDRVSVMAAIATVQDTIEELDDALSDCEDETLSTKLTAPTAGRIKEIYVAAGDAVADVMYEYGALMRISMDGMMAVSIETDADLAAGDTVVVTLADGTEETGRVESVYNSTVVITLTDDGPQRGDEVSVFTEDGEKLGSGSLYIHSELKVTAFTGTVKSVSVKEEQEISSGRVLMYLQDREDVTTYESLLAQRSTLEAQMAELFQLYQTGTLFAPCDGKVTGVEDYIAANLSSTGEAQLMLLANAPGDDPDASYVNFIGKVTAVDSGAWQLQLSPSSWDITDYALLSQMSFSDDLLTQTTSYTPGSSVMLYTRSGGAWVSYAASQVKAGDTVLFAFDPADTSRLVWIIVVPGTSDTTPEETEPDTTEPDTTDPTDPSEGTEETQPSTGGQGQKPSGSGSMGGSFSSGSAVQEQTVSYEVPETQAVTITPLDTMQITITVDELDVLALEVGQQVAATLDAMPGQSFAGVVAELRLSGSNSGGNSKFTAVIEIPRTSQMLPGMNASVSVMLESHPGLLTVPVDALVEQDGKVYLYTTHDEQTDALGGLTEVTTGLSDGQNVQITGGISEGDTYYYSYLDTVNYQTTTVRSTAVGFSFGRMR